MAVRATTVVMRAAVRQKYFPLFTRGIRDRSKRNPVWANQKKRDELELSRSMLQALHKRDKLVIDPDLKEGLRRRVNDGACFILDKD